MKTKTMRAAGSVAMLMLLAITFSAGSAQAATDKSYNSVMLMEKGQFLFAVTNIVAHDVLGLLAIFAGRAISRAV